MKKLIALMLCSGVAVAVFFSGSDSAQAIPAFKKEYDNLYVKKDSADPKEKALADAVAEAKCNVCHVGKSKKDKNAYGEALGKLLDKKADAKNVQKIQDALKEVEGQPSDSANPASPTFGDLFKEGKLP